MIDYNARQALAEQRKTKTMMESMKQAIVAGLSSKDGGAEDTLKLVFKKEEDPQLEATVRKIGNALALIYKQLSRPFPMPKIFNVKGSVEVSRMPRVEVTDFKTLVTAVNMVNDRIAALAMGINNMPQPRINIPKIELPKLNIPKQDTAKLEELVKELNNSIEKIKMPEVSMTATNRLLEALVNRPVMTPTPVTNVGINGLEGFAKSTQQTVGTSVVELPSYGQLFNRRSMIIFNNSASTAVYIGGSDVTPTNGLPVLGQSYSPALDAGYDLRIYGLTASNTADVRVFEVSKDQSANVQE